MVHCEGGREGGEEGRVCSRLLCHTHLHLAVDGLKTGYCRDVHGEVRVQLMLHNYSSQNITWKLVGTN